MGNHKRTNEKDIRTNKKSRKTETVIKTQRENSFYF